MVYESRHVWIVFKRHINQWDVNEVMGVYLMREKAEEMRRHYKEVHDDDHYFYRLERHEAQ